MRRISLLLGGGVRTVTVIAKGRFLTLRAHLFAALFIIYRTHALVFCFPFRLGLTRLAGAGSLFKVAHVSNGCFIFSSHSTGQQQASSNSFFRSGNSFLLLFLSAMRGINECERVLSNFVCPKRDGGKGFFYVVCVKGKIFICAGAGRERYIGCLCLSTYEYHFLHLS
jgi:hypothetical protein